MNNNGENIDIRKKEFFEYIGSDYVSHLGTFLLGHLTIENLLLEFLKTTNPNLKNLEVAKLGYSKLLTLTSNLTYVKGGQSHLYLATTLPKLRHINKFRNILAHNYRHDFSNCEILARFEDFYPDAPKSGNTIKDRLNCAIFTITYCVGHLTSLIETVQPKTKKI